MSASPQTSSPQAGTGVEVMSSSAQCAARRLETWGEAGDLRLVVVAGERVGGVPAESFVATH